MPTLEAALVTYLKVDRSDYTNRSYQQCLERMISAIGSKRDIRLVTYEDLLDYTSQQLRGAYRPATYRQYVNIIKGFFNWSVKLRYIEWSPAAMLTARKPPTNNFNEKAVPEDVLDSAMRLAYPDARDYAVIAFMKGTAARVGGVASLQVPNLDLHTGRAWIRNKGGDFYWVYFGQNTVEALRRYLLVRPQVLHNYVFVGKRHPEKVLTPPAYSDIVARWTQAIAGVKYRGHSVRHRTTHDWDNQQVPLDVLRGRLNHTNIAVTNEYLQRQNPLLRELSQSLDKLREEGKSTTGSSKIIYLDESG